MAEPDQKFVPKFYKMDPKTEDLLPNGSHLANGMKILTANPHERVRPEEATSDWLYSRLMELNRWQTVTHLEVGETLVRFVGVYDDGVKVPQRCSVTEAWLVKIDSVSGSLTQAVKALKRRNDVLELVKSVMDKQSVATYYTDQRMIEGVAEHATEQILGMFDGH